MLALDSKPAHAPNRSAWAPPACAPLAPRLANTGVPTAQP